MFRKQCTIYWIQKVVNYEIKKKINYWILNVQIRFWLHLRGIHKNVFMIKRIDLDQLGANLLLIHIPHLIILMGKVDFRIQKMKIFWGRMMRKESQKNKNNWKIYLIFLNHKLLRSWNQWIKIKLLKNRLILKILKSNKELKEKWIQNNMKRKLD